MPDEVHLVQIRSLKWMHFWVVGSSGSHLEESPPSMPPQHLELSSLRALPRKSFPEHSSLGLGDAKAWEVRVPKDVWISEAVEAWVTAPEAFRSPRPPATRESTEKFTSGSAAPSLLSTRCLDGDITTADRLVLTELDRAPVLQPGESLPARSLDESSERGSASDPARDPGRACGAAVPSSPTLFSVRSGEEIMSNQPRYSASTRVRVPWHGTRLMEASSISESLQL
jgi:hypothetical protein